MENRKRVFGPIDKKIFHDIIRTYSTIIESKETDGATRRLKNEAWVRIAAEFNSNPSTTFNKITSKQLRRLWTNLKQRRKERHRLQNDENHEGCHRDQESYLPTPVVTTNNITFVSTGSRSEDSLDSTSHHSFDQTSHQDRTTPIPLIPKLLSSTSSLSHTFDKDIEQRERIRCLKERHEVEMMILKEKLREARAKADLAEVILSQQTSGGQDGQHITRNLRL